MAQKIDQLPWNPDHLAAMAACVVGNPWGANTEEILGGSELWQCANGSENLLIATKGIRRGNMATLEITGLVSLAGRMQTTTAGNAFDTLANLYKADAIALQTIYPHLGRGAMRLGFSEVGRLYKKQVNPYGRQ